ncbi:hypothetical protein [Streptomyces triticiradicis]|uniref:hypothetical protein n=1 Tax=Streptomyces triticiradicis TaxID=2651189 RepID=UPI001788B9EE|nr:hypothetical protein [Streptomyces triticiradicis]
MYLGALLASAPGVAFFGDGATGAGLHAMAWPLLGVAAVFLLACAADRSPARVGRDETVKEPSGSAWGGRQLR